MYALACLSFFPTLILLLVFLVPYPHLPSLYPTQFYHYVCMLYVFVLIIPLKNKKKTKKIKNKNPKKHMIWYDYAVYVYIY